MILHGRGVGKGGASTGWLGGGDGGNVGDQGSHGAGGVGAKKGAGISSSAVGLKLLSKAPAFMVADSKYGTFLFPFCSVTE